MKLKEKLIPDWNKSVIIAAIIAVLFLFLMYLSLHGITPGKLAVGEKSKTTILATKKITNKKATDSLINERIKNTPQVYRISPAIEILAKEKVSTMFSDVRDEKLIVNSNDAIKASNLVNRSSVELTKEQFGTLLKMDFRNISKLETLSLDILSQVFAQGIMENELNSVIEDIDEVIGSLNLKEEEARVLSQVLKVTIEPNKFVDLIATEKEIKSIKENTEPIFIEAGDIIVRKGDIITQAQLDILEGEGFQSGSRNISLFKIFAALILLFFVVVFYFTLIMNGASEFLKGKRLLMLLVTTSITIALSTLISSYSIYLMPLALPLILISSLSNKYLGYVSSIFTLLSLQILLNLSAPFIIIQALALWLGTILVKNNTQRYQVLLSGGYVSIISIVIYVSYFLIGGLKDISFLKDILFLFSSGVLAGVLALGLMPIWENVFKLLTPFKLLELMNSDQELIKRLQLEAPGTYHHSILVGNLSEEGADVLKADALLAKAGAYYHDIGKLKRPYYFKENQMNMNNPHDKLEPIQSLEIIIAHREDGIKLGKDYKLPQAIIDIIEQHHGTTLMSYFYYNAKKDNPNIPESKFRYPGRKPQTKEAAIVMLADSCEAAVRSIKDINDQKIEDMVTNVINSKVDDDQFSQIPINKSEIEAIKSLYISILKRVYHLRIEYPNELKQVGTNETTS